MKVLDSGEDKVKKICDVLKKETLDPAKKEAKQIVDSAYEEAKKIVARANEEVSKLYKEHTEKVESEKQVLKSSLKLACKQSLEAVKHEIEKKLLSDELGEIVQKATSNTDVVAQFINAMTAAAESAGLHGNIEIEVAKNLDKDHLLKGLSAQVLSRLKDKEVRLGGLAGGAVVKFKESKISLEITDEIVKELLMKFCQDDFREIIFTASN